MDTYYGKFFDGKKFNALASSQNEEILEKIVHTLKLDISSEGAPIDFLEDLISKFESIEEEKLFFYIKKDSYIDNFELVQNALDIDLSEAISISEGSKGITSEQVKILSERTGVNAEYLVFSKKNEYEEELSFPLWKDAIRMVMEKLSVGEAKVRRDAMQWLMNPARADGEIDNRILTYFNEALKGDVCE